MIINNKDLEIRNLGFEDTKFKIQEKDFAKIFSLLSNSTYKDKEGSIIREIASNAVDANILAGKSDSPIIVGYDEETSEIYISDFGVGMSDEFINTTYISLGSSTKEQMSNQIGGWGVGRMSIFSKYDFYTLVTTQNKIKNTYVVSKGDDGLPIVSMIETEEGDFEDGTTVRFKIDKSEYKIFRQACLTQLKYFENVIFQNLNLNNNYTLYRGKSFVFKPSQSNNTTLEICWGNIYYPINFPAIEESPIYVSCALYFPQETPFQPEVARENLQNTPSNISLIKEKIREFKEEIQEIWMKNKYANTVKELFEKQDRDPSINIGGNYLDVSNIVDKEIIYTPVEGLNFKRGFRLSHIDHMLFSVRVPSKESWRYSSELDRIFQRPDEVFYCLEDANPSTFRLGKISWRGIIKKREITRNNYLYRSLLENLYGRKSEIIQVDQDYTLSDVDFDPFEEICILQDIIWKEITSTFKNIMEVELPKTARSISQIKEGEEIRGKLGSGGKLRILNREILENYITVVYTNNSTEFETFNCFIEELSNFYKKPNLLKPLLCAKKYNKFLPKNTVKWEDFCKSSMMKKWVEYNAYRIGVYSVRQKLDILKNYKILRSKNIDILSFYDRKYKYFNNVPRQGNIYASIVKDVNLEMVNHIISNITKLGDKVSLFYDTYSNDELKYKLLYNFFKKQYHAIKTNRKQPVN